MTQHSLHPMAGQEQPQREEGSHWHYDPAPGLSHESPSEMDAEKLREREKERMVRSRRQE